MNTTSNGKLPAALLDASKSSTVARVADMANVTGAVSIDRAHEIYVREWMTSPVQVVSPSTSVGDAYDLMMHLGIRRLPVVENEKLTGIVTLGDLREARPSPSSGMSIYELNYLLSKLTVDQIMTHYPYTVTPDTPVIKAAQIMLVRKVSGLPVVDNAGELVGIITESDLFRMLVDQWTYFTRQHVDPGLVASLIAERINV